METLGEWLKKKRRAKGWAQVDLAKAADVTIDTISRTERGKNIPELRTMRRLTSALGVDFAEVEPKLNDLQAAFEQGMRASLEIRKAEVTQDAAPDQWTSPEANNVAPYSYVEMPEVPFFEAPLAAGHWAEVAEYGIAFDPCKLEQGLFRVRIRGDSMTPTYRDNDVIEFKILRNDDPRGVVVGRDYYVQKVDGEATFKRVERATEETFYLRPLNRKKYPELMQVERSMVCRMAVAVATVNFIE